MLKRILLVLVMLSTSAIAADVGGGKQWWSYVEYLASDKLEGRLTGSEGHRQAAEYVAARFQQDGLQPAGTEGYIQPVEFVSRTIVEKETSVALERDGQSEPLRIGEDVLINAGVAPAPSIHAPLAFVGYGLSIPEKEYDDLAGQDLRGKIAVFVRGGPSALPGALRAHAQSVEERWRALHRAGALGAVFILNPRHMDIPWSRLAVLRFQPSMQLAYPDMDESPGNKLAMAVNPAEAERLFTGSGHTFAELMELVERGVQLPRFPLAVSLEVHAKYNQREVTSQNVAGVFPGADPTLKNEYVVLSAHVDHLGVGEPIDGDRIYNGAMDNAAGVATLLEVADALHTSGAKPRRSLLFLVVTGEEKGLLGSKYYAAHPTVPIQQIAADVNIDMFLPLYPLKRLTVYGLEESDLGALLKSVAAAEGVEVQPDPAPERNVFIRSDQYSFIKKGIPSITFSFGYIKGSPEEAALKDWLTHRYHAPSDDTLQPVDLEAAAKYNQIVLRLTEAVADRSSRPQWEANSFFRRYAK